MLMEQNVLRSNWPISDHDYPAGTLSTVEQQHFPSLMSFHSYSAYPPAPQRFKEESPRTFGSLYSHQHPQHQQHHQHQQSSSSSSSSHHSHQHIHHSLPAHPAASMSSIHSLPLSLSIPRPAGASSSSSTSATATSSSRKASEEERKAKHREAQRRFVKRKKAEMVQLKQLAIELELQYQLLEATNERTVLERENHALERDVAFAREHARHSEQASDGYSRALPAIQLPDPVLNFEW